ATEIAMESLLELRLRAWTTPPIYYLHPRVEHISPFDFDHLRELVEEGYRATIAALDRPEEWPAPGDEGVYPKRRVTVRVQRERCIGWRAGRPPPGGDAPLRPRATTRSRPPRRPARRDRQGCRSPLPAPRRARLPSGRPLRRARTPPPRPARSRTLPPGGRTGATRPRTG